MNTKKSQKSKVKSQNSNPPIPPLLKGGKGGFDSRLIFILGGCRSGKSAYALKLAESIKGKKVFLATGEPKDDEMLKRIKKHKKERGNEWTTIEEPIRIADVIKKNNPPSPPFVKGGQGEFNVILVDCLTLWISNMLCKDARCKMQDARIKKTIDRFISVCKRAKSNIVIVSNEVGLGIVPDNPIARKFRDIAGYANQNIAKVADEVYFVVSGMPMRLK